MNTIESNKLIADFMELEKVGEVIVVDGLNMHKSYKEEGYKREGSTYSVSGLQYRHSWEWLMTVIGKIGRTNVNFEPLSNVSLYSPIELVYNEVVLFIKWYNENKE